MRMQHAIVAFGTMGALFAAMPVLGQNSNPSTSASRDANTNQAARQSLALRRLQQATLELERAIDAMYRQPAVSDRNRAIGEAHQAISEVSLAMRALPPELRESRFPDPARESMERLRNAAQQLRESVQSMAQYPVGGARNNAIDRANQALFNVQQSMIAVSSHRLDQDADMQGASSGSGSSASTTGDRSGQPGAVSRSSQQKNSSGSAANARAPSGTGASSSPGATGKTNLFGVVIMPALMASNESLGDGCWARLYENPEYGGNTLTLVGPVDVRNLGPTGVSDWNGVDSLITGPKARVSVFQQEDFADRAITVEAGQRVERLRQKQGVPYLGRLESVRVACSDARSKG